MNLEQMTVIINTRRGLEASVKKMAGLE